MIKLGVVDGMYSFDYMTRLEFIQKRSAAGLSTKTKAVFLSERKLNDIEPVKLHQPAFVIDKLQEKMPYDYTFEYHMPSYDEFYGNIKHADGDVCMVIYDQRVSIKDHSYSTISFVGDEEIVEELHEKFTEIFSSFHEEDKINYITWSFVQGNHQQNRRIYFDDSETPVVYDSHYPFIANGLQEYFTQYTESKASILLLMGDPGTGKTSFIREYIRAHERNALICYDEELISMDSFFVDFISSDEYDTLVIEDADVLISTRESEQNKVMSKFLNVSDGLVKHKKKKIIFTTNIRNLQKIDSALVRPGRCFDTINFRELTLDEAKIVANHHNRDIEKLVNKKTLTLTDIFNDSHKEIRPKLGFIN